MKRKIIYIIVSVFLVACLGIIVGSALMVSNNDSDNSGTEKTQTLSFENLCKEKPESFTIDYFTNLINETIEEYERYDFIEIKETSWLLLFEWYKMNNEDGTNNAKDYLSFDESDAQIITIDTANKKMSMSSLEGYEDYLNDVYRIILSKLYYSLSEVERVLYSPKITPSLNRVILPSATYAFGFDETKYTAQAFVDDYKKTVIGTGVFAEQGDCIDINLVGYSIYDIIGDKSLYPTAKQQDILNSFN